jgi:hypothetical protein
MKITFCWDVTPCCLECEWPLFIPENGDSVFLRNVGKDLTESTVSHPRDAFVHLQWRKSLEDCLLKTIIHYSCYNPVTSFRPICNYEAFTVFCVYYECHHVRYNKSQWPESASELYRPSNRSLSAKLAPTFTDIGCHMVSITNPFGRILGFLDRSRYYFFQAAPKLYSQG